MFYIPVSIKQSVLPPRSHNPYHQGYLELTVGTTSTFSVSSISGQSLLLAMERTGGMTNPPHAQVPASAGISQTVPTPFWARRKGSFSWIINAFSIPGLRDKSWNRIFLIHTFFSCPWAPSLPQHSSSPHPQTATSLHPSYSGFHSTTGLAQHSSDRWEKFVAGKVSFSRTRIPYTSQECTERRGGISVLCLQMDGRGSSREVSWLKVPWETIGYFIFNLALHIPLYALIKPTSKFHYSPVSQK